ncbi:MAG TPA: aromatic ring-hydroxylating dioxygenase subunit alpha [Opitutaceae bacterium]|jgi:vanillate O-demethylase monooxygenase subunit
MPITSPARPLSPPRDSTFTPSDWTALSAFWHPVCFSSDIAGTKPYSTTLLDEKLVLYRAGGTVVAAKDVCIHRGVPLSYGWIDGDEVVCAYHGFRYGADGRCTRVPAQPDLPIPKKLCLQTFPAEERYGLIWVCLAGAPRQAIPDWPELEDGRLMQMKLSSGVWKCSAARHVENFNDLAHLSWVHVGTFGNREQPEVPKYDVEVTDTGMHFEAEYERHSIEDYGKRGAPEPIHYSYDLTFPFYTRLRIRFAANRNFVAYNLPCPQSARETKVLFRMTRDFDLDGPEDSSIALQQKVVSEDRPFVEAQRPEELPLDLSEEFHIRSDRFSTCYRGALVRLGLGGELVS